MKRDFAHAIHCLILWSSTSVSGSSASDFIPIAGPSEGWLFSGPAAISGDGTTVISGGAMAPGQQSSFRWTESGGIELIRSASPDPTIRVGVANSSHTGEIAVGFVAPDDRSVDFQAF